MFFLFILSCLLMLITMVQFFCTQEPDRIGFFILYYFIAGYFWFRYDGSRSRLDRAFVFWKSGLTWGKIVYLISWPIVSIRWAHYNFKIRKRNDRFSVLSEIEKPNPDDEFSVFDMGKTKHEHFGNWSAAFQYALSEAKRLDRGVSIFDDAKIRRNSGGDELTSAMYEVTPDGKVRKCFSFWR